MKPLISLDVFDTAIFRKVFNPNDIFSVVEDKVGHNFRTLRMVAQNVARRKDIYYSILDIYKNMQFPFNPKEEIKAEYDNCVANPYILDLYNNGEFDFIFISDMYLPSVVIKSMLEKCGYKNPKVFVSCELRALKGDGTLFKRVQNNLGRKIEKHIGDNYHVDIMGAQKAGIPQVEFIGPAIYNKEVTTPLLKSAKLRKLLIDNEFSDFTEGEKIGYLFAPLILAFTQSLLKEASNDQTIFFNARDSYIMYIIARWILKTDKKIKYCRFSRKSCHLPNINTNFRIDSPANRKAMNFLRTLRISNIGEFIETFNFKQDYTKALEKLGVKKDTPLDYTLQKNKVLEGFVEAAQDELFQMAREQRKNFKAYINQLGMKNKDIFVDLGHFGSMQSIIRTLTGIDLKGRYVHRFSSENYLKGVPEEKRSFLPIGYLKSYTGIVELVFSEPTGTSVSYTSDGRVILNKDVKFRKDITKGILRGVIRGVKDILKEEISIPYDDITTILDRFLKSPTIKEAEFANLPLFENGSYDENESVTWYNQNLIRKGKLKECYNRSYWKPAFKILMENDPDLKGLVKVLTK